MITDMRRRRAILPLLGIAAFFFVLAVDLPSFAGTSQENQPGFKLEPHFDSGWAYADLDGDHKADLAISRDAGHAAGVYLYLVELKLSHTQQAHSFTFSNTDGLGVNITAVDVDGDKDLDLVISGRFPGQRIGVWINEGAGSFTQDLQRRFPEANSDSIGSRCDSLSSAVDDDVWRLPVFALTEAPGASVCAADQAIGHLSSFFSSLVQSGPVHLRAPPPRL